MVVKKTKECPFCWEDILETAKKCKYCWEFLDEELRLAKKREEKNEREEIRATWVSNYSWCSVIKRWLFQWRPKVICPRCWYKWRAKYISWSYSWCLFLILLFFAIIPWLIYYAFASWWKYVCPQCWEDHLRRI